ncbi:MAG: hypothetical protein ABI811_18540 [Acidobacteriota bacterium]
MNLQKAFIVLLLGSAAFGQTKVDLRTQSKSVDFTAAAATLPVKTGTSLPASCQRAELFFKLDAVPGANLYGCASTNTWTREGGSDGASSVLEVIRNNPTTLSIGSFCSTGTPCNVRFGNTVYSIQNGATATVSAGSATAFIFISSAGVLTVGHTLTLTCSAACLSSSGVSGFPVDSIPLFTWSATGGTWDATGGVDFRAFLSSKITRAGLGLIGAEAAGITTLSVDPTMLPLRAAAPASATSACTAGRWAFDSSFFYVCIAANTWVRAGMASW